MAVTHPSGGLGAFGSHRVAQRRVHEQLFLHEHPPDQHRVDETAAVHQVDLDLPVEVPDAHAQLDDRPPLALAEVALRSWSRDTKGRSRAGPCPSRFTNPKAHPRGALALEGLDVAGVDRDGLGAGVELGLQDHLAGVNLRPARPSRPPASSALTWHEEGTEEQGEEHRRAGNASINPAILISWPRRFGRRAPRRAGGWPPGTCASTASTSGR